MYSKNDINFNYLHYNNSELFKRCNVRNFMASIADPTEKTVSGSIVGIIVYTVGSINVLTIIAFMFIMLDFLTGVMADFSNEIPFDKKKAEKGLYKKAAMVIFWFCAVLIEIVLREQGGLVGIAVKYPYISLVATFYMLGTEILSTMNNLAEMGFKTPKWFVNIANRMKNVDPVEEKHDSIG